MSQSNFGGPIMASLRNFRTEGPVQISPGGRFLELQGAVLREEIVGEVDGEDVRAIVPATKITKNRWVTIEYFHPYKLYGVPRGFFLVHPSPELVKLGTVRSPGMVEPNDGIFIKFKPDANMDLADLESHIRVCVMEPLG
jgi:hypothetical protein